MVNTAGSRCLQKGRTEKAGKGHTHIFPFSQENPVGPERTKTDVYKCAVEKNNKQPNLKRLWYQRTINPSGLKSYDIVLSTSIDNMHW